MGNAEVQVSAKEKSFPPFSLKRLLSTVFRPKGGERLCLLVDFENPREIKDFSFLGKSEYSIQSLAHEHFYLPLNGELASEMEFQGGEMFAYKMTGGSNLDLPDEAIDVAGDSLSLENDIYPNYDIILCISTYSATAPLTAFAKQYGFRGATLHGLNEIILSSGLAVDYEEVSKEAEKLRLGMTKADAVELDFVVGGQTKTLRLELGQQEAQKSHGLCQGGPDIANLPAGEIYFVPTGAEGFFPLKFEEEDCFAWLEVKDCRVVGGELISGNSETLRLYLEKVKEDPVAGELGELGFGTQVLPVSGRDIQDEKVLGTFHVATGRSDHLGGSLTPDKFKHAQNATHDDILFAPHKTPEVGAPQVRMYRSGEAKVLIENYQPAEYMQSLLASS